jgi:hypothetical protein
MRDGCGSGSGRQEKGGGGDGRGEGGTRRKAAVRALRGSVGATTRGMASKEWSHERVEGSRRR